VSLLASSFSSTRIAPRLPGLHADVVESLLHSLNALQAALCCSSWSPAFLRTAPAVLLPWWRDGQVELRFMGGTPAGRSAGEGGAHADLTGAHVHG